MPLGTKGHTPAEEETGEARGSLQQRRREGSAAWRRPNTPRSPRSASSASLGTDLTSADRLVSGARSSRARMAFRAAGSQSQGSCLGGALLIAVAPAHTCSAARAARRGHGEGRQPWRPARGGFPTNNSQREGTQAAPPSPGGWRRSWTRVPALQTQAEDSAWWGRWGSPGNRDSERWEWGHDPG